MDVGIFSIESIKPSMPVHDLKPFKLSLLDQISPLSYSPMVLFFKFNEDAYLMRSNRLSKHLKLSLSKNLNHYYPLSGRLQDNLFIHNYGEGVPFTEARVRCRLSEFLQDPQLESLNQFLPYQPFCLQPNQALLPQVAIQTTVFDCGAIALGMCFLHKTTDGGTGSLFVKNWAQYALGSPDKVALPNLFEASTIFPPMIDLLPPTDVSTPFDNFWFQKRKCKTKRFAFDTNAVNALRAKGKSELVEYPTRVQALSAFIWKSAMAASAKASSSSSSSSSSGSSPRKYILTQAMSLRGALNKPKITRNAFGNLYWNALTKQADTEMEMPELVAIIKDGITNASGEFFSNLSGEKGSEAMLEFINQLGEISKANTELFGFTSWNTLGSRTIDFGWGAPVWSGLYGEASRTQPCNYNYTVLKDAGRNNHMEAWMTMEEEIFAVLEQDPQFLAFATPNPSIPSPTPPQFSCVA